MARARKKPTRPAKNKVNQKKDIQRRKQNQIVLNNLK